MSNEKKSGTALVKLVKTNLFACCCFLKKKRKKKKHLTSKEPLKESLLLETSLINDSGYDIELWVVFIQYSGTCFSSWRRKFRSRGVNFSEKKSNFCLAVLATNGCPPIQNE